MKQTFNIPDGCKTVSVEQVGNQIITSFEPEKYVPRKGDFIKFGDGFAECISDTEANGNEFEVLVAHWKPKTKDYIIFEKEKVTFKLYEIKKLTPEEFQAEFEKLGYVYDFETHTARKKRKRVAEWKQYFFADHFFKVRSDIDKRDDFDDRHFELGNYFETEEECQKYCDYMRECSIKYFNK